ncbi:MAG TPA: oxidoreductase, partial [Algoriphagus sp.]|nr:oxidoreductase [Algoriphagus sp.]
MSEFEICGLVARGESKNRLNEKLKSNYPLFDKYEDALAQSKPDAVCISTYPDTHEEFAIKALEAGCHIFIEKPLADTVTGC